MKVRYSLEFELPPALAHSQLTACLADELGTLAKVLGCRAAPALSVDRLMPSRKAVSVRVPVVVCADGSWAASGCSDMPAELCRLEAEQYLDNNLSPRHTLWLAGEMLLPHQLCIRGMLTR